jgi:DNA-binding CsgD family transcriptional regulator
VDGLVRLLTDGRPQGRGPETTAVPTRPSERELEVLQLVAAGLGTAEVAGRLCLSGHTVRTHLKNATRKLGARSRVEAALLALKAGWISLPTEAGGCSRASLSVCQPSTAGSTDRPANSSAERSRPSTRGSFSTTRTGPRGAAAVPAGVCSGQLPWQDHILGKGPEVAGPGSI